jgi:hypothetical protein
MDLSGATARGTRSASAAHFEAGIAAFRITPETLHATTDAERGEKLGEEYFTRVGR